VPVKEQNIAIMFKRFAATISINLILLRLKCCQIFVTKRIWSTLEIAVYIHILYSSNLNHLISATMSDVTCCLHFPWEVNSDLLQACSQLDPIPETPCLHGWVHNIDIRGSQQYRALPVLELTQQRLDNKNMMCAADPCHGHYLTVSAMFSGTHEYQ
jgi:tubulin beta